VLYELLSISTPESTILGFTLNLLEANFLANIVACSIRKFYPGWILFDITFPMDIPIWFFIIIIGTHSFWCVLLSS
jgi:hypothetical protein